MDDPLLEAHAHFHALVGLERINAVSRTARAMWKPLKRMAREVAPRPLRVLDIASGAGDLPRALMQISRRRGVALEVDGSDVSRVALSYSQKRSAGMGLKIRFFRLDPLRERIPGGYDVIMTSLFLHHLADHEAVALLRAMAAAAGRGILVDDLARDRVGFALAWAGTRLLSRSPVVHADGIRSVRAAFTPEEAAELARTAGLTDAVIKPHWPRRWLLEWRK